LEIIGNFTHMHMRNAHGQPQTMVPDNAGALFAKYAVREGPARGLGFSLGADYMDEVSSGAPSVRLWATDFPGSTVPKQPTFFLAPRTVWQAGVSYKRDRWSLAVVVQNLTNKDYLKSAQSRNALLPGEPRNYSATLELRW
jgi:iron complex outermembrane receptor protein